MLQQLFVPVLFLVAVSGNPSEKECELEKQAAENCTSEANMTWNTVNRDWNNYESEIPKFEKWVKCVGEPVCPLNAKYFEGTKIMFNIFVRTAREPRPCLDKSEITSCRPEGEVECGDLSFYDCVTDIMKQSDACTQKDVNTYISFIPDTVRFCKVRKEIKELLGIPPTRIN
ncbi:hypothetical protein CRE_21447 [Caenorhabditis remanei]|uniref:Uncharacterized protein n=1 Tax=Caenorhabditis remanei TaxID=31234 RepID=E3N3P1_CAERE|nr:hypothetical protein CRE_21447 [Caenorhabditis remanei]